MSSRDDLRDDLLSDLQGAAAARPLPPAPPPLPPREGPSPDPTPAIDVRVTPLRWSRPRVVQTDTGRSLRVGPVRLSVSFRD